jgi:starch phosphorylase
MTPSQAACLPPDTPTTAGTKATDGIAFRRRCSKLTYMVGKDPARAGARLAVATSLAVRDRIVDRWVDATRRTYRDGRKRVYYFSLEF